MKQDAPETYTNRELAMLISSNSDTNLLQHEALKKSMEEFHKITHDTLQTILAQTTKTNGRVNKLEMWRSYTLGAMALLTFLIPITMWAIEKAYGK